MEAPEEMTVDQFHRRMAASLFNGVWDLLEKAERTEEENDTMIHASHASRYHWQQIGKPINFERGDWQISRVYAVLGRPEPALHHARKCLDVCLENNIGDFDIAFAYEAMARANAAAGNVEECRKHLAEAIRLSEFISKPEDKAIFKSELDGGPWYNCR